MAYTKDRERVMELRRLGKSLNEIVAITGMKKSTISMWCRDIALNSSQIKNLIEKQRIRGNIGLLKAAELKRQGRLQNTIAQQNIGASDIGELSRRDLMVLGIGLYWGEGYKNINGEFGFTNSDPKIIRVFLSWITQFYKIDKKDLILRVSINKHFRSQADDAIKYWSSITNIPASQFTQTSLIKTPIRKIFKDRRYIGTLRIKVRRGTNLLRRVLGSISHLANQIEKME